MQRGHGFPRGLRECERDALLGVLPETRPGYLRYRNLIAGMEVLGQGRRGQGHMVLGGRGDIPDVLSAPGVVVAYGMIEATNTRFTISVREYLGRQIDAEIVSSDGSEITDHVGERRCWTFSTWSPGAPSPDTGAQVREVAVGESATLALCPDERRLWVHDRTDGMVYLLPITNFHNEVMLVKGIRDPEIALRPDQFFHDHARYDDADLRRAFIAYNAVRRRVTIRITEQPQKPGVRKLLRRILDPRR